MLVAISGSQGSGKTTVLNELAQQGFKIVERKSARSVMAEKFPGMTLDELYADPLTAMRWQDEILKRKLDDERDDMYSKHLCFTERTHADLFTYAVMAIGKNNAHSDWVNHYYNLCQQNAKNYLHTFYIVGGHFKPVADGVRGTNQHYSTMIDTSMQKFTSDMLGDKMTVVDTPMLPARVRFILTESIRYFTTIRSYDSGD